LTCYQRSHVAEPIRIALCCNTVESAFFPPSPFPRLSRVPFGQIQKIQIQKKMNKKFSQKKKKFKKKIQKKKRERNPTDFPLPSST